jgi:putative ABC transport system ATP-binding protein
MIQLKGISKVYQMGKRELEVLKGVDLRIDKGEMVAIMGPSGSGKTTLLNVIGCLDQPTSGDYHFEGREVSRFSTGELSRLRALKIGFIFQSFNLLPRLSALANVELGLKYAGIFDRKQCLAALERVGLADRSRHRPTELSGGEQQRVAIARAIVKNPPLIIADEPTGNLDSRTSEEIITILTDLHRENNVTLVMVTHEADIARHCQRIIRIRDGNIVAEEKL